MCGAVLHGFIPTGCLEDMNVYSCHMRVHICVCKKAAAHVKRRATRGCDDHEKSHRPRVLTALRGTVSHGVVQYFVAL